MKKPEYFMKSILITGTNGKTSISYFLEQILLQNKIECSRFCSIGCYINGINQNLPDSFHGKKGVTQLKSILSSNNTIDILIWEVFSSSLQAGIYDNWKTDIAVLSNISEDHYELHGSEKKYKEAKFRLFSKTLKKESISIIIKSKSTKKIIKWHIENNHYLSEIDLNEKFFDYIKEDFQNHITKYIYKKVEFKVDSLNIFSGDNLRFAIEVFLKLGFSFKNNKYNIQLPNGRLNFILNNKSGAKIIIDYAHNVDAFKTIIARIKEITKGKIILIFGCGGDRDKSKRKKFAEIANQFADITIVTDDNPRYEDPSSIRLEIIKYCPEAKNISDRNKAIELGIKLSSINDYLLILGRGHENNQEIMGSFKNIKTDEEIVNSIIQI